MEDYGLGYPGSGDLALRGTTKRIDPFVPRPTAMDRIEAIQEHGTKRGYEEGCRGSHCPGKERLGMSCSQASIRYAGDMGYRRRVDGGMTAEEIWAEDQADRVVMPKVNVRDNRQRLAFEEPEVTVEDSVLDFDDDEQTDVRSPLRPSAAVTVPVVVAEPAAPVRGKWAIRKEWAAVSPEGEMCGPFREFDEAKAFVAEQAPPKPPKVGTRAHRRITDEDRATFRRLHSEGLSTTKIGQRTGRALTVVSRELLAMGLTANGHRFGAKWS